MFSVDSSCRIRSPPLVNAISTEPLVRISGDFYVTTIAYLTTKSKGYGHSPYYFFFIFFGTVYFLSVQ